MQPTYIICLLSGLLSIAGPMTIVISTGLKTRFDIAQFLIYCILWPLIFYVSRRYLQKQSLQKRPQSRRQQLAQIEQMTPIVMAPLLAVLIVTLCASIAAAISFGLLAYHGL